MDVIKEEENFNNEISKIIDKIKLTSRFMIVGTNQSGKTNLAMHLLRGIRKKPEHEEQRFKTTYFDPAMNLRYKFDEIPYVDRTKNRYIPLEQDLIIDVPFTRTSLKKDAIMDVLLTDFQNKREAKMRNEGKIFCHNFYFVDEMQNVWGTYALRRKDGETALTVFSESSNYGMVIVGLSQRFASVSTEIVERCAYFFVGRLSGDNEINRLKRMVADPRIISRVRELKVGEFIFIDKDNEFAVEIDFNLFEGVGKPYELKNEKPTNIGGIVRNIF